MEKKSIDKLIKYKEQILDRIERIKPRLHRVVFSGDYGWNSISNLIGRPKILNEHEKTKKDRRKGYANTAVIQLEKRKIRYFYDPIMPKLPRCILETSYPTLGFLLWLNKKLPKLKMSRVEYTADVFFSSYKSVKRYFRIFNGHAYFPYQRWCKLLSKDRLNDKDRIQNAVLKTKSVKIYERGPDEDKKWDKKGNHTYWDIRKTKFVRFECTARRKTLLKAGIGDLSTFLMNPKLASNFEKKIGFKVFVNNEITNFPEEFHKYPFIYDKKNKNHGNGFHNLYISYKKLLKTNIKSYMKDEPVLSRFLDVLTNEFKKFDENWIKKREEIQNKKKV